MTAVLVKQRHDRLEQSVLDSVAGSCSHDAHNIRGPAILSGGVKAASFSELMLSKDCQSVQ